MKKCEYCGGNFEPNKYTHDHRFCCVKCCKKKYWQDHKKENKEKVCENCGKEFMPKNRCTQRFCCSKCNEIKWRQENPEKLKEDKRRWYQENKGGLKEKAKKHYQENKEKVKEYNKRYYLKNSKKLKEQTRKYREENPENIKETQKRNYQKHRVTRSKMKKKYNQIPEVKKRKNIQQRKNRLIPRNRINHSISTSIWQSLKGEKSGRHWEHLVGYTVTELMEHLEKQFDLDPKISWKNYGFYWHIHHIRPKSKFHFTSYDKEFKECWALSNLMPLEDKENMSRGDRC